MKFWKFALAASVLVLSTSVNAAIVTHGYLSTNDDGTTNIITDSLNNVEYLRLDVLAPLTYAETLAVLDTQDGGGWAIASNVEAVAFTNAILSSGSACSHNGANPINGNCGTASGWSDGNLGANFNTGNDYAFFLDDYGNADYIQIRSSGLVLLYDFTLPQSDTYSDPYAETISWLVVRPVPVPAAVWLFGSGLIGLAGFARRKKA